ncbi:MAG: S41 family peptidase [Candidatus Omnitrophica bacterium]|nr:S41 family peptidase [Candidatus Omnitrophota bacterium]
MKIKGFSLFIGFSFLFLFCIATLSAETLSIQNPEEQKTYQNYLDFFEEIYQKMEESYYYPVKRENFDRFIDKFNTEIYGKLDKKQLFDEFVSMRSGALLVDFLKTQEDIFSALYPPQAVDDFKEEVLGRRSDLGIEGQLVDDGYKVSFVEVRSDAYEKGLRENDILVAIGKTKISELTPEMIVEKLMPEIDTISKITYLDHENKKKIISVKAKEYFKQTVFPVTMHVPDVYCLQIRRFNQKTAEDLSRYLIMINQQGPTALVLDLRGNPGGPPLAAREIASFFLKPGDEFAYFQRKGDERNVLDVPRIPDEYLYRGPVAILVDKESGSASELFSGIMQKQNRALLFGSRTAGQVFLKSMFSLDNDAMLLLVTARGHFPDGDIFNFDGLVPQFYVDDKGSDLTYFAAGFLTAALRQRM